MSDGCGQNMSESLGWFDPGSRSWRTSQVSLLADSMTSLQVWPRSGMTRNGMLFQHVRWVRHTCDVECSLLPTPQASDHRDRGSLAVMERRIRIGKQVMLSMLFERAPCPSCVERIMGFPRGWTDLEASETPSSRR
jgi:hypothetical protein